MRDSEIRMGEPVKIPDGARERPSKKPLYTESKMREDNLILNERYIFEVMMPIWDRSFLGAISGDGKYGAAPKKILPCSATSIRSPMMINMVN